LSTIDPSKVKRNQPTPVCSASAIKRVTSFRQQISDELLRVQQGSLYPALHRLEHQGWIRAEWGASDNNRRARFYALTRAGRKQLATEVSKWERLSAGVSLLRPGATGGQAQSFSGATARLTADL
jgi:transcriptional regulator